jgi:hypothetical protein
VLQTLSNNYIGYFMALPIALVVADGLRPWRSVRVRALLPLAVAALAVGAALAPVVAAYVRARTDYHQTRSIEEIASLSADARSYLVGKNTIGVWRWLPTAVSTDPERELFPGIFAVALGVIGFCAARRDPRRWRWARLYGLIAVAAAALSLGPIVRVWGTVLTTHGPYDWLLRVMPGMDGMRVPARFAIIVVASLSVLVALGVAYIAEHVSGAARPVAIVLCSAAVIADGWAVPIPIVRYSARGRAEDRAVASWLADRAPGALLHLPALPSEF